MPVSLWRVRTEVVFSDQADKHLHPDVPAEMLQSISLAHCSASNWRQIQVEPDTILSRHVGAAGDIVEIELVLGLRQFRIQVDFA